MIRRRMKYVLSVLGGALVAIAAPTHAAPNPGDEVVVVYNTRVPESKDIAEYYVLKRHIPTNQVFGFDLPTGEDMSRREYELQLQLPLAKAIKANKLWHFETELIPATNHQPQKLIWRIDESKIRYAALCYGVPVRISPDPSYQDDNADKKGPEMKRNEAAVDSELALLPLVNEKVPLNGPVRNPLYGTTNEAVMRPTLGVLLVTRLDGPTPAIARALVDKALQGEADGLWGRTYFDLRNTTDPAYKMGDDWIRNASEVCRHLGFETIVDNNPETFPAAFPMSQIAIYIGWYDADVSGPFTRPTVEFMPGAFAYHLHSYSAHPFRSTTRAWVGPLLAKGATVTMGCVEEPYLSGTPDMTVFTSRFVYSGMSFGEAAYAAQPALSWQVTVVGDPLYRPFGKNPDALKDELLRRNSKLLEWYYLRLLNANLVAGKTIAEGATVLEQFENTKISAVLTEKLGDLYAAQGKPASAAHAYQQALLLDPTPQQKIRLQLALGEKLTASDQPVPAYDTYQTLLRQNPDFPDKNAIYKLLLPLAQKLGKTAEISSYRAALDEQGAKK
ncbi:MAG TPA: TIGR03790 family protein [Patescibacteria group bacterium]|nr:TIGR03790 family protein [Patescibacteria group bacterium]